MAEEWTIGEVRLTTATRMEIGPDRRPYEVTADQWEIDLHLPDGRRFTHFLPVDTVAWRIAEYDLDHTDPEHVELALDMALYEPHIPQAEPEPVTPTRRWTPDGVVEETSKKRIAVETPEDTLLTAPTLQHARDIHLERIAQAKERVRVVAPASKVSRAGKDPVLDGMRARGGLGDVVATSTEVPDPLQWMREHAASQLDADDVAIKRAGVERARQRFAAEQAATVVPSAGAEDGTPT